jgi:hypothetical protein
MATLDILSGDEAKVACGIGLDDTTADAVLGAYVSACSLALDKLCGPIVNRTFTSETYDGGGFTIFLKKYPLSSVTTVTEYLNTTATVLTAETNASKTTTNYVADLTSGMLTRRASNRDRRFPDGRDNVVVTYVAGRAASTAVVDQRFKVACGLMLSNIWRRERGAGTVTFGPTEFPSSGATFFVPNAVRELLIDDIHGPVLG